MATPAKSTNDSTFFDRFAERTSKYAGSTGVFVSAFAVVLIWAVTGPFFQYSET